MGDVMKIGIIAAMPEELAYLIQHLENASEEMVLGNTYHTGRIGAVELVLVESGIGKVMAAMSVAILADHFKVDAVINTGSAGALAEGISVGDVVIAEKLAYHDVDVTAFGYEYGQMAQQPLYFESDKKFVTLIQESLSKLDQNWHLGLIATGDSFVAGDDKIEGRRFAYLTTLNQSAQGYTWGTTGQVNYEGDVKGISEGDIGVSNLTWETVKKYNFGFELGLWNMIDFNLDLFREKRSNIFMKRSIIPSQSGFINNPWANFGKVTNGGVEMSLNFHKQWNKDWFTSAYANFTYAKNRVDEYDEPEKKKGTYRAQTGRSLYELQGLTAERLFTNDDFNADGSLKAGIPSQSGVGGTNLKPGDVKYVDKNGDNAITEEDAGFIGGTIDPRIVYGFGGVIAYKNFDFNFFFQGVGDSHRIIGGTPYFIPGSGTTVQGNAYSENISDRWTTDNQDPYAFWPRFTYGPNVNNYRASTWWKKDMSFLRCKTIELGYTLNTNWLKSLYVKSMRVYVSGNNLFAFSKFKLWDPELGTSDGLRYPMNRSIQFGVDINF